MVAKVKKVNKTNSKKTNVKSKWFKIGIPVAVALIFAGFGIYMLRSSSADAGPLNQISSIAGHSCITSSKYPATLRQGSTGECVKALQIGLNNWASLRSLFSSGRIPYTALKVDGIFGSQTTVAVRDFQASHGLGIDGIVGQNTWDAFLRDCSVTKTCNFTGTK